MTPLLWVDQQPPAPYEILWVTLVWVLSNGASNDVVMNRDCYLITLKPLLKACWVSRGVIWQASPAGLKRFQQFKIFGECKFLMHAASSKDFFQKTVITDETIFLTSVSGEFARKMLNVFWSWFLTNSLQASGTSLLNSFFAIRDVFSNVITGRMNTFLYSYSQLKGFTWYLCNCVKLTIHIISWMLKDSSTIRPKD